MLTLFKKVRQIYDRDDGKLNIIGVCIYLWRLSYEIETYDRSDKNRYPMSFGCKYKAITILNLHVLILYPPPPYF